MISTPPTGSEAGAAVSGSGRPLFAGDALALIGCGVGTLVVGATTGRWLASLALVGVAAVAIVLDALRAAFESRLQARPWRGRLIVLDFDVFALGMLAAAWAVAGATGWLAGALGALALALAAAGYAFRHQVLTAFMAPASSPLGILLAVIPAVAAIGGGGGFAVVRAFPGPAAPAIVMAVCGLYILLFAQAALLRVEVPSWRPPAAPRSTPRSRRR